jgi:hypothetical protein
MNQRATDTHEQVLKFAPKEKAQNRVAELDDAGQAIVAQIRTAADLAKEDCDRAMTLAHKLSMELRAAEDRTQRMTREVEHWRDRATRADNGYGRFSKRLKRSCSLGDHPSATRKPQSVSFGPTSPPAVPARPPETASIDPGQQESSRSNRGRLRRCARDEREGAQCRDDRRT